MKEFVKYYIQPQRDGSYVIVMKDKHTNKRKIHSHHDSKDEAETELDSLEQKPSQADAIRMIQDLRNQLNNRI